MIAQQDSPWPLLDGIEPASRNGEIIHGAAIRFHGIDDVPLFLNTDGLPPELGQNPPDGLSPMTPEEWNDRPRRAGGAFLTLEQPTILGPFVELTWSWRVFDRREPDETPEGYAGGGTLTLLRTDAGWRVVGTGAWIT